MWGGLYFGTHDVQVGVCNISFVHVQDFGNNATLVEVREGVVQNN